MTMTTSNSPTTIHLCLTDIVARDLDLSHRAVVENKLTKAQRNKKKRQAEKEARMSEQKVLA